MLPAGTVLFTSRAGIGKTAILAMPGCTNQGFQSIVPNKQMLDSYFIFTRTEELKKYGLAIGSGSTFTEVSGKQMASMPLRMPATTEEQKAISRFFYCLDKIITLHQRKVESVKKLKKSLLQKMFPKEGETASDMRFPGFTDAWEQRKLSHLGKFTKGRGYSKKDLGHKGSPIVLYGNLYTNYQSLIKKPDSFAIPRENSIVSKGREVLIPASGETSEEIARASAIIVKETLLGGDLNVYTPGELLDPHFVALSITYGPLHKRLSKLAQGKTVVHLQYSSFQDEIINFPQREEQEKISTFFETFDGLITLHQR